MLSCHGGHLLRGDAKEGRYKNSYQWDDERDVVQEEIKERIRPQLGNSHDKSDGGKINLGGTDYRTKSNDESSAKSGEQSAFELRLFPDDSVDFFLHAHWQLKFPFGHLASPEQVIIVQADDAEY